MTDTNAGGRNTQAGPSRAETLLEAGLSELADAVAGLMTEARAVDPAADEYGHARNRAYTDAVTLLKASARLGHTIAELRGTKFEHTINVRRQEIRATSPDDEDEEEDSGWMWLGKETLFDWKNKRTYRLEKPRTDGAAAVSDDAGDTGEGTPLPISGGSNGNFEAAGEPKIGSL